MLFFRSMRYLGVTASEFNQISNKHVINLYTHIHGDKY